MDVLVKYGNACFQLIIIYRPLPSKENLSKEVSLHAKDI